MRANLAGAGAKLEHQIIAPRPGAGHDLRCHGGGNRVGKSDPGVIVRGLVIKRAGRIYGHCPSSLAQARALTEPIMPLSSCSRMWQ